MRSKLQEKQAAKAEKLSGAPQQSSVSAPRDLVHPGGLQGPGLEEPAGFTEQSNRGAVNEPLDPHVHWQLPQSSPYLPAETINTLNRGYI